MAARYLVPALAVAGRAAAQCSVAGTTTIQSSGDATALASCSTFSGSIALATDTAGQIALDGIKRISGSLIANNVTQVTGISADSLEQIDDTFGLNGLTILTGLNFPMLTTVDIIDWEALPNLQGLSFTTTVQMASTLSIQNTQLSTLEGIDLQVVDTVIVTNNPLLNDITMQLGNITSALTLQANGQNVSASFPNLEWAYNMTIQNVSSINIPSLASLNGSLGFYANFFSSISAPNLTTVGGSLSFVSNADLTNISMPELTTVTGGLQVANNTALQIFNDFGNLQTVGGALDFYGNFTDVELPGLKDVRGGFNLLSSNDISANCTTFENEAGSSKVIKGKINCHGNDTHATGTTGGASGTSGSGDSATSSAAANALFITGATGLLGVVAAIFGML